MAQMNSSEMEEFQNLSDRYQAELAGPLIGDKLPMEALVTEYAQADPVFVVKTTALAHTHSAYRAIKGDGQCGWRGAVFAYFELLLQLGDMSLWQQEMIRLRSFEESMKMAGIDYDIIIDMFDFTWELFEELRKAIERQDKHESVVLSFMNDEIKSNSIVYHFKMMTSAHMQVRPDQYEPFLEISIHEYRVARIDPSNQEIDQIGLQALTDAIISPAGFALEVLYLDRSLGEEVTPHPFSQLGPNAPTIRLLYRPGHYDIVYKGSQQPLQVYFYTQAHSQQNITPAHLPDSTTDFSPYMFPPSTNSQGGYAYESQRYPPQDSSSNHWSQGYYTTDQTDQSHAFYPRQVAYPPPVETCVGEPYYDLTMPTHYSSPQSTTFTPSPGSAVAATANEPQIRLTATCHPSNFSHRTVRRQESIPIDSGVRSGAVLDTSHFRNRDFEPQMWSPDQAYSSRSR